MAGSRVRRHRSHISSMRPDRMRQLVDECPFTVFVLTGHQVSIPISTPLLLHIKHSYSYNIPVVTSSSTVNDLMHVLVWQQIIPTEYSDVYGLGCGHTGSLLGSSTMKSLGVGSLSTFHLRVFVRGGAGKQLVIFYYDFYSSSQCRAYIRIEEIIVVIWKLECSYLSKENLPEATAVR